MFAYKKSIRIVFVDEWTNIFVVDLYKAIRILLTQSSFVRPPAVLDVCIHVLSFYLTENGVERTETLYS